MTINYYSITLNLVDFDKLYHIRVFKQSNMPVMLVLYNGKLSEYTYAL